MDIERQQAELVVTAPLNTADPIWPPPPAAEDAQDPLADPIEPSITIAARVLQYAWAATAGTIVAVALFISSAFASVLLGVSLGMYDHIKTVTLPGGLVVTAEGLCKVVYVAAAVYSTYCFTRKKLLKSYNWLFLTMLLASSAMFYCWVIPPNDQW